MMIKKDSKSGLQNDLQRLTKSVNRLKEQNLDGEAKSLVDTISQSLSSISKSIEAAGEDKTGGSSGTTSQQDNQPNARTGGFNAQSQGTQGPNSGTQNNGNDQDSQTTTRSPRSR